MTEPTHLFATLTPDAVLDALEAAGCAPTGELLALNSYENRVYQARLEDGKYVVAKFYRPQRWTDAQILEEHAYTQALFEAEIPVVPAIMLHTATGNSTLLHVKGHRMSLTPRQAGRAPELDRSDTLEWIGRFIARIHVIGARECFASRPAIDVQSHGLEPRDYLLTEGFIPEDLRAAWTSVVDDCLQRVKAAFESCKGVQQLRLHGDVHAGNVLWVNEAMNAKDQGPHFVDFDDARQGPAVQDLWMLLSGDRQEMTAQLSDVLSGYEDFREFDRRELALIEPLRTLRMIHYSAWIARRWTDPAFPAAFPWFNTQKYWQDQVLILREQISAMEENALIA
jgi:Ser/Thr protein kinase RdoA (MazF antagonist)